MDRQNVYLQKRYVIPAVVVLIALLLAGPIIIPMSDQHRLLIMKTQGVVIVQVILTLGSMYAWSSVRPVIDYYTLPAHPFSNREKLHWLNVNVLLLASVIFFLASSQFSFIAYLLFHEVEPPFISMYSFSCLGIFIQYITCYFILSKFNQLYNYVKAKWRSRRSIGEHKRIFVIFYIAAFYAISTCSYGLWAASLPPTVKQVNITIKNLPRALDGLNIALLSDIHMGTTVGKYKVDRAVNITNSIEPDIVAVCGDLVDDTVEHIGEGVQSLKNIKARLGKFFVTGNHEYYNGDINNWITHLEGELGFTVLHNSHVTINDRGGFIYLAGTDDIEPRRMRFVGELGDHGMDLDKAVGSCDKNIPIVLLAHQPMAAMEALNSDYNIQLVLSGHTHGGQMMPMTILGYLANPFFSGLYSYNNGQVYVTHGTMYWGIPMRMFSQTEITHIFLRSDL